MPQDLPESAALQQEMSEERSQERARIFYVASAAALLALLQLFGLTDRFDDLPLMWTLVVVHGLYTALVYLWLHRRPGSSITRRLLNIFMDTSVLSAGMWLLGDYGALCYPLFLWIVVGYGMRFGPRYLLVALGVAGTELALIITFNDFWAGQPVIGTSLLIGLLVLPFFNWILLKRLFSLNQELDHRVSKRTAELQEANAELARASHAKDEFLATMSHELRTPLTAILGLSQILADQHQGPLNSTQLEFIASIEESGQHLLDLINGILDVARIEFNRMELHCEDADIRGICESSVRLATPTAREKGVSIALKIDHQAQLLCCDGLRLKQMLVNLLDNAAKFTPEGGRIGLEVESDATARVIRFHVWDTGIGIAEEDLPSLFQPFVQLDNRLARKYGGTGLGLMLVYRMADLHGGGVSVQSRLGEGSRFTVHLPWEPGEPATASSAADTAVTTPTDTVPLDILLAEDHDTSATVTSTYLQGLGHRVRVARDGLQVLDLSRERLPDLVLMDIHMPGMDGLETIRRIRSDPALKNLPVIALTALSLPGDRKRCLRAGVTDYLAKPFRLESLAEAIGRIDTSLH